MKERSQLREIGEEPYDLIVIGGGIVGAGVARDAALRGLSVALFEKGDFASGTSSRTSRMVHGGIRYLEQGALRLVFDASRERALLYRLAPHLVQPLPFLFPIYQETGRSPWTIKAGMLLYDLLALFRNFHRHRMLSTKQILQREPGLSTVGLRGGALFYDAQMDDARLCLEVVLSAQSAGAKVFNYMNVEALLQEDHKVRGVMVQSGPNGIRREIRARQVVNAAGPWLDHVAALEDPLVRPKLRTTRGSHLVVPAITRGHAVVVTSRRDRRVFFVLPWNGKTLIGTTDQDYKDDPGLVHSSPEEVAYLLGETGRIFPRTRLTEEGIIARFSGVRPLVYSPEGSASSVSRETEISEGAGGMLSVVGGKYTLHRLTAEKVVDQIVRKHKLPQVRTLTAKIPLLGGGMENLEGFIRKEGPSLAREYGLSDAVVRHLICTYGTRSPVLLESTRKDRRLLSSISAGTKEIVAQIDYAVKEEMAVTLSDFLRRRTSLALSSLRRDPAMVNEVAIRMGTLLAWNGPRRQEEIQSYLEELE